MESQSQFNVTHILGQAVDVANYNTYQHHLHNYGNVSTISSVSNFPSGSTAGPVNVQNIVAAGQVGTGHGIVTMSYAHNPQSAPAPPSIQSYHAVFNNMGVNPVNSQLQAPQVQYFSYESPVLAVRTPEVLGSHHQQVVPGGETPSSQGQHIRNCSLPIHVKKVNLHVSKKVTVPKSRAVSLPTSISTEVDCQKKANTKKERMSIKVARKTQRNKGESYVSASGKLVEAKKYVDKDCKCKYKCLSKLGTAAERRNVFKCFWEIGDFNKQNVYLSEKVILMPNTKRKEKPPLNEKNIKTVTRLYYVKLSNYSKQIRVCKTMFLHLHGISNGRLDRVLQVVNCQCPDVLQDKRGQHTPSNKTPQEDIDFIVQHLWSIRSRNDVEENCQTYSHLPNHGGPSTKDISIKKMYEIYQRLCKEKGRTPVSLWVYRQVEKARDKLRSDDVRNVTSDVLEIVPPHPTDNATNCTGQELREQTMIQETLSENSKNGRVREGMSRHERKIKRNSGAAYFTVTGKLKKEKSYVDKECGCKYHCIPEVGTEESRKQIFDNFWKLGDFTKQNEYISQNVSLVPVVQKEKDKVIEKFTRTYTRIYNVQLKADSEPLRVCKMAFLHLHGISNGRVDRVLQAVACQSPFALKDRRGHHPPKNKTKQEDVDYVCHHIQSFPLDNQERDATASHLCLPQDLNVEKMYHMYKQQCHLENRKPVGSFVYRKILKEKFNYIIKSPANKTPEEDIQFISQHIAAFLRQQPVSEESDEGQERTNNYLEPSARKMHLDYIRACASSGRRPVAIDVYRKIFNSQVKVQSDGKLCGT